MLNPGLIVLALVLAPTLAAAGPPSPQPGFTVAQAGDPAPPEDYGSEEPAPPDAAPGDEAVAAAARLREAVARIDPDAEFADSGATFHVGPATVILIYDINADRMRLVSPVEEMGTVDAERLMRLMQANFDSALDARYAVAKGVLWSVFIHPLSSLTSDEFGSGLGQTVNLVANYGSSYSSGAFIFGGGDSAEEQQELIEELQEKSRDI